MIRITVQREEAMKVLDLDRSPCGDGSLHLMKGPIYVAAVSIIHDTKPCDACMHVKNLALACKDNETRF